MIVNGEEYQKPEWLTNVFLEDVLKEHFKDDKLTVSCLRVEEALGTTGISSLIHRVSCNMVRADYSGHFSVIIKEHPTGYPGVVAHRSKLFKREIMAYKKILPRVESLLASIQENHRIAPACYYATETPEPFLILEDLQMKKFENYEKGRLLNLDYLLITIEKIAKLHACSVVMAAENPQIMEFFKERPLSREPDSKDFMDFFPVNMRHAAKEIAKWPGFEEISEKIIKLSENVLENAVSLAQTHRNGFCVFNMSDIWIQNLMFNVNNESKEPTDVRMMDYQLAYYGSPSVDLLYLLYGSGNENVRKMHFKFIIREYHRILKETLEKLDYKGHIPTLKEIHILLIENSLYAVIATTCLAPIIFSEAERYESLDILNSHADLNGRIRINNVRDSRCRTFLQRTVKELELSGFLDI